MGDLTGGAYAAIGAACVAGFFWLLRQGFRTAVRAEFQPLTDALTLHMENEETAREEINGKLDAIGEQFQQNEIDHLAFDERLRRLEH